ncbi:MAG: hypothetical protein ACLP50_01580 [Solirubrobacteraceae bacterium]
MSIDIAIRQRDVRRALLGERDCVTAGLVGCGMVGIAVLFDAAVVPAAAYYMLFVLDGGLLVASHVFHLRTLNLIRAPRTNVLGTTNKLLAGLTLVILGGLSLVSGGAHTIQPQSEEWWQLVAGSFIVGLSFWWRRRKLDMALDEIPLR